MSDYTSYASTKMAPLICDICSKPMWYSNSIILKSDNGEWVQVHLACYDQYIGKCATCSAIQCELDKDNTAPKFVTKIVRQGNFTAQTQVLNPSLVDKHCRVGCQCWDSNRNSCVRQNGQGCQNYKLIALKRQ